jgi:hypothetical protein
MSLRRHLFLLAALALPLLAQAPAAVVQKIVDEGRNKSQVMAHLDHLTNTIGPRLTGSERLTKACEWARDQFTSYGLKNVRLEQWGTAEVGFDRGVHSGFVHRKGQKDPEALTFGTHAWTPGTDGKKRGKAVLGPAKDEEFDAFAGKARGAWVLRAPGGDQGNHARLDKLCVENGALGVIRDGGELILTSGNLGTTWDSRPKLVSVNLHRPQYEKLTAELKAGAELELELDVQNHFKQGPIPLYNVLAELPGTDKKGEIVIVGGHIDSWDGATGTTDNGTGVATTLEAARLLARSAARPRRTIRFMLWSGEEQGLLGSRAYIKAHPDENDRISAVLVHDGGTNYVSGIKATKEMLPLFEKVFAPVVKLDEKHPFQIQEVAALPRGIGSDHDSYLAQGVPGFFWNQSGQANYTFTHHTQHDVYTAAIADYQKHTSMVVAIGALGVANLGPMVPRGGGSIAQPNAAVNTRRLGVQFEDGDLKVTSVREESVAARAGLKVGDKVLGVDGQKVSTRDQLAEALNQGGERKKLSIERNGKPREITVTFPKRAG